MPLGRVQDVENGVASKTSTWIRISDHAMSPRIKCGSNYQNSRLAILEAAADGYKTVLFINQRGKLSEGPGYCIFLVRKGVVVTPSVTSDILESITRLTLIDLFQKELGVDVEDREVDRTEMYVADEAFFCGTRMEIVPVTSLDRIPIGDGKPGALTKKVQQIYFDIVRGKTKRYAHWLTPVY
jgi:branched-chain amino acid aminotransferase